MNNLNARRTNYSAAHIETPSQEKGEMLGLSFLPKTFSFLALWSCIQVQLLVRVLSRMSKWVPRKSEVLIIICLASSANAAMYAVVQTSTGAPASLQANFLASTTNQYQTKLIVNPFTPNTFQLMLYDYNPLYNPPVSNTDLLNALVTVDSYTYVYGWADGETFERSHDLGYFTAPVGQLGMPNGGFFVNCSSAPYFNGLQISSTTNQLVSIDSTTCNAVLSGVYNFVYQQFFSTPTIIGGNWQ